MLGRGTGAFIFVVAAIRAITQYAHSGYNNTFPQNDHMSSHASLNMIVSFAPFNDTISGHLSAYFSDFFCFEILID